MGPHGEAQDAGNGEARNDDLLRVKRPAAERREEVPDDREAGQQEDVDLRMAEEPEHVIPQEGAALGRREEHGPERAVRHQEAERGHERGECPEHQQARENPPPRKERQPHEGHPRGAEAEDRDEEIHGRHDARRHEEHQGETHHGAADRRAELDGVEGRVRGPSPVRGPATGEEAGQGEHAAGEVDPVAEGVQPRESHVPCANLDRHEVVRERGTERGDHPQEHEETVGRDELVVLVRLEEGVRRDGELKAEGEGEEPRRDEEVEGSEQVENPDILVVRREKPPFQGFPIDHRLLLSARCTIRGNCPR